MFLAFPLDTSRELEKKENNSINDHHMVSSPAFCLPVLDDDINLDSSSAMNVVKNSIRKLDFAQCFVHLERNQVEDLSKSGNLES